MPKGLLACLQTPRSKNRTGHGQSFDVGAPRPPHALMVAPFPGWQRCDPGSSGPWGSTRLQGPGLNPSARPTLPPDSAPPSPQLSGHSTRSWVPTTSWL